MIDKHKAGQEVDKRKALPDSGKQKKRDGAAALSGKGADSDTLADAVSDCRDDNAAPNWAQRQETRLTECEEVAVLAFPSRLRTITGEDSFARSVAAAVVAISITVTTISTS